MASFSRTTQGLLRGVLLVGALGALGLLLAAWPLPVAAGLVIGVIALVSVLAQPLVGLALLIVAVPLGSPFNVQVGGFNFGPTEILFVLTVAAWLGRKVIARELSPALHPSPTLGERRGARAFIIPPMMWPLAAFVFALALTLTVTHSLPESLKELIKWFEVVLVVSFTSTMLKRRHIPAVLILTFIAAAIEAAIGLYQTIARVGPQPFFVPLGGQLIMRAYGTFEQPNPFAAYLNWPLPIIVSLLLSFVFEKGKLEEIKGNRGNGLFRLISADFLLIISLLILPVIAAAFFFSLSRGAWLGFAFAFVVMTAFRSRRAFILFVGLALVGIGLLVLGSLNILPPAISERIADVPTFFGLNLFDPRAVALTLENFAVLDRMAHWFAAWNMFNASPWLGVGIGNYGVVYPIYGLLEWPFSLGHAHNFYLNMLAEAGLIGLTSYLLFITTVIFFAWGVARRSSGLWRAVALGILGALVAMAVHNFFDNLYVHGMNIQFALLLGLLASLRNNP